MERDLAARREPARRPIRIGIAEEEQELEEHQARRPYRGGAPEPRENLLRYDRLDEKQQERADEDREGVENHRGYEVLAASARPGRIVPAKARIIPMRLAGRWRCLPRKTRGGEY